MKVLSICTSDTSGGAARAAYRIHRGLRSMGGDSRMFVKNKSTNDDTVISLNEFLPKNKLYLVIDWFTKKIKNKWQHHQWNRYKNREKFFMSDMRSTSLHGALQKIEYDVIHLHWVNLRFLDLEELKKIRKPIVWTMHDSWAFCGICHYFFDCEKYKTHCAKCKWLNTDVENDISFEIFEKKKKIYEKLNVHVVAPSRWIGECARNSALFGKFPVTVIPNCLDTNVFSPREKDYAAARWLSKQEKGFGKTFILYGAVNAATDKVKGFVNLLSALHKMEEKFDSSNMELLVFGADKPIDALQLKMPVRYLGYVNNDDDMALLYSLADVVVVPSLSENLSYVIMESLSCCTPVVAFNVGGNSDMIDHKENGYLASTEKEMADGIIWCIENNRDGHLGENARLKVLERYTVEIVSRQYFELYNKVFEENEKM